MIEERTRTNKLYVTGTLVEVRSIKESTFMDKEGKEQPYVSTKIVVKYVENDNEHLIELDSFTKKYKADGGESKLYPRILDIEKFLNKRVTITNSADFTNCTINGNRFWSAAKKEVVNSIKFNFLSIREAFKNEPDSATFDFGGFVYQELQHKEDEDGNLEYYTLQIAQPNYNNSTLSVIPFVIEKDNSMAARTIQNNYKRFSTVQINGILKTKTVERKAEAVLEEIAFGEAVERTLPPITFKQLVITGGSKPAAGDLAFTEEEIKQLLIAYKEEENKIKTEGENADKEEAKPVAKAAAKSSGISLDDLI